MPPPPVTEFAPAKVNLTLHVTGQRADGYHLLDSLVVFADVGDRVTADSGQGLCLRIEGPQAAGLSSGPDNLVLRAARAMGVADATLTLWKALPLASGIGGGSADAAATLRALARLTGRALPPADAVLALGADVPVCLAGSAARMSGVGEVLEPVPPLPPGWLVLVNPAVAVPTPAVFAALSRRDNPPQPALPRLADAAALAAWLAACRNDLEPAARAIAPVIGDTLGALSHSPGCLLARMSGSGATCFGLFASPAESAAAAAQIRAARPGWWVADAAILGNPSPG
ncbi:MAG: 4-(cytidine 5'-diphospho)-2-C-methyl-D-erythritol kinase [Paracoccaceae bacterium]|nr:MAG: 4-(cytidine 5'-diphospho)-2-C-methyl-D-erythritol kinase [Paracoccaceae bacterium]